MWTPKIAFKDNSHVGAFVAEKQWVKLNGQCT